ncbi:MAG: DASS family sodium-coupled anion symporter [Planctomycetes bacterium]|nr:DASS family sodium-coupled anion symporter [Planctomycetota bacterium]
MANAPIDIIDDEDTPANSWVSRVGLVLGPVVLIGWLLLARDWTAGAHYPLSDEAHRLAGIMMLTVTWWLTEPIPIPATALLAVVLAVVLGGVPRDPAQTNFQAARIAMAPFADPTVFFLLGGLFLGRAMTRHGLDRRFALGILCTRWAGRSPSTVMFAVGLSVAAVSMWISNTAATAMIFPITLGIVAVLAAGSGQSEAQMKRSPYASALLLVTAYASSVGGVATPIGTTTNVVSMGLFRQDYYLNKSIDFFRWCQVGIPLMIVMFVALYLWMRARGGKVQLDMPSLRDYLQTQRAQIGPWRRGEYNTLIVFITVVSLWVAPGALGLAKQIFDYFGSADTAATLGSIEKWFIGHFPEEIVALGIPVLLFLLPINLQKREFSLATSDFSKVDWGTMLLFGAGLSLGNMMFRSGLAEVVGNLTFDWLNTRDVWLIAALAIAGGIVLSEFTSNAATVSTLFPVIWSLCKTAEVDPLPPLLGLTFGASFGSALPVSTPPNAIVYGSGLIPLRRMVAAGIGIDIISGLVIWGVLRVAFALGWSPVLS